MHVKTHQCSPALPLTQDIGTKGQMCTGPAGKAVAGGWRVFSKSSPEVRVMPEIEMGLKPSRLWRTPCHGLCKLHLSTKKPRNIRFVRSDLQSYQPSHPNRDSPEK